MQINRLDIAVAIGIARGTIYGCLIWSFVATVLVLALR